MEKYNKKSKMKDFFPKKIKIMDFFLLRIIMEEISWRQIKLMESRTLLKNVMLKLYRNTMLKYEL